MGGGRGEERKYPEAPGVAIDFSVQTFHIGLLGMAGGRGEGQIRKCINDGYTQKP
jgi:hypothetical protein